MLTNPTSQTVRPRPIGHLLAAALTVAALAVALLPAAAAAAATPPSWSAPVDLSESGVGVYGPQVAVDPAGDAAAVWMQAMVGGGYSVQAATRPAGGAWTTPVKLSSPGLNAAEPTVAIDAHGDAIAVWQQTLETTMVVAATHVAGAASWSVGQTVSNPMREAGEPRVAIDPGGDAVVLFTGRNAAGNEIVQASAEQGFGGEWGAPILLSAPGADASRATLGIDDAGEAIAVWQRPNNIGYVVQASRRPAGGSWSAPESLSGAGGEVSLPRLAVNANGDAAVIWSHFSGTIRTAVTTRSAGGTWSLPRDLSPEGQESFEARVALDAQGDATVLWVNLSGEYTVQSSTEAAGTGVWSAPVDLVQADPIPPEPSLAIAPGGDAVVAWQSGAVGGTTTVEAASRKGADGAWSSPGLISAPTDGVEQPDVAIEPNGAATAIWGSYGGGFVGVQSATFDPGTESEGEAEVPAGGGPGSGTVPSASGPTGPAGDATQPPAASATKPPAAPTCPRGKALRKVKVPARGRGAKAKKKTRTVLRCVKPNPHRKAHHHQRHGNRQARR